MCVSVCRFETLNAPQLVRKSVEIALKSPKHTNLYANEPEIFSKDTNIHFKMHSSYVFSTQVCC